MKLYFKAMFLLCYDNLSNHKTPKQKPRKPFDFDVPHMEFFLNLKTKMFQYRFNNIAISTFLDSIAVDLPTSYSDRYLILKCKKLRFQ